MKISQNSQEFTTPVPASKFSEISINTFSYRTPPTAASKPTLPKIDQYTGFL